MTVSILDVNGMNVNFVTRDKNIRIIEDFSLSLKQGESLGLVGESGCGKTVTAMAIAGILRGQSSHISGQVNRGPLAAVKPADELSKPLTGKISMAFQDALASLNPVLTIGKHLVTLWCSHHSASAVEAREEVRRLLKLVGLEKDEVYDKHPWEISGGMAQRVCIASALCSEPDILIADEPTASLDNLTGTLLMQNLQNLRAELGLTLILISHDLAAIANNCDRIIVMYTGRIVEEGFTRDILRKPAHPYTKRLVQTFQALEKGRHDVMPIEGQVPGYQNLPKGCSFHPRCHEAREICSRLKPELKAYVALPSLKPYDAPPDLSEHGGLRKLACHVVNMAEER